VVPVSGFLTDEQRDAVTEQLGEDDTSAETLLAPDVAPKPKRGRPKGRKTRRRSPTPRSTPRVPSRKTAIKAMLETVGNVWHISELTRGHEPLGPDFATCGSVLLAQADAIATNLNTLAQQDEGVARWLDAMMSGGGWGGVVLSTWPVAQAVLAAHVMPGISRRREAAAAASVPPEEPWSDGQTL